MNAYRVGDEVLHASILDNLGQMMSLIESLTNTRDAHWHSSNDVFKVFLNSDANYAKLYGKMF